MRVGRSRPGYRCHGVFVSCKGYRFFELGSKASARWWVVALPVYLRVGFNGITFTWQSIPLISRPSSRACFGVSLISWISAHSKVNPPIRLLDIVTTGIHKSASGYLRLTGSRLMRCSSLAACKLIARFIWRFSSANPNHRHQPNGRDCETTLS